MSTGQEVVRRTPQQELVAAVRGETFQEQVKMALPPTVTLERFVRVATSALLTNPDIAELDHVSVLTAMVQCAAMGLMPDGKQAAITPRKGKAVLVPMIQGFRDIAADHGWTLRTAVVYANDDFRHVVVDGEEAIFHAPVRPGDERGALVAAYAIAKHRDGRKMQVVLHPDDIAKRRESSSYDVVWNNHPAAMWEKSAGRDLFAQLGFGEVDERVMRILEASDTEPAEASRLIYGPPHTETPAQLPPAGVDTNPDVVATSPPSPAEAHADVDTGQQTAAAATPSAAAAVPGTDELAGEPGPEPESPFQAPTSTDEDPTVFAAKFAAQIVVPIGQWRGKSLAEVHAAGEKGAQWFRYALSSFDDQTGTAGTADPKMRPGELVQALEAFARVYLPDEYQAALAKREVQS